MSAADKALDLFSAGVPVRDIGQMTGISGEPLRELLTRSGQRSKTRATFTFMVRVCPFFDACRDCTLPGCALDKFREVTV